MVKIFNKAIYNILGSHRFAEGGTMNTDETDRPISQSKREVRGVNEFNTGGSHEENPYGGIPQGVAPDGAPNLVEQGEVKLSDIIGMDNQYILSNRLVIDAEHAKQFNIPESVVGMTYAAAFKKLYQPLKERSGNTEVKNEIAHLANAFMQAQDSVKAEQEAQQASAIMQSLSPEEQQQMMQMAAGQQGQPSPEQQQQMMQQQMMAQQQGQMAQDPSMMGGGQQMPPESMMGQGGQPSPEEMAMMQQQDPSMMGGQQPMMARGGRMYNRFNNGGNMKINKDMFCGLFSHKFAMGGAPFTPKQWAYLTAGSRNAVRSAKGRKEAHARQEDERQRIETESENAGNPWDWGRDSQPWDWGRRSQPSKRTDYVHAPEDESENAGNRASKKQPSSESSKSTSNKNRDTKTSIGGKSTDELARLVIRGKFGTGKARKEALGDRYAEVQKRVNELMSGSGKKAKVKDERGGTKEIEIPDWVRRSDEMNLQMNPIESRIPKPTRDISASGERLQRLPSNDELHDELYWTRHLDDIPGEFENDDNDGWRNFDEIVNRARKANLRR